MPLVLLHRLQSLGSAEQVKTLFLGKYKGGWCHRSSCPRSLQQKALHTCTNASAVSLTCLPFCVRLCLPHTHRKPDTIHWQKSCLSGTNAPSPPRYHSILFLSAAPLATLWLPPISFTLLTESLSRLWRTFLPFFLLHVHFCFPSVTLVNVCPSLALDGLHSRFTGVGKHVSLHVCPL